MSDSWPMRFEISINNPKSELFIHSNQGVFGECSRTPSAKSCVSGFTLSQNHVEWDQPNQVQAFIDRAHHQSVYMEKLKEKAVEIGKTAYAMLRAANIFLAGADDQASKLVLSGYEISAKCVTDDSLSWNECPEILVGVRETPPENGLDGITNEWDFATSTIHIVK